MRRGARLVSATLATLGVLFLAASCSLGLDESKIEATDGGNVEEGSVIDTNTPIDGNTDSGPKPLGGPCTQDAECVSDNACLKGRCDQTRKACVFDVCKPATCSSATCDTNTKTCGPGKTHPYRASQFVIPNGTGCGPSCFAAVWPYLFVSTATGMVAYSVSDPAADKPAEIPITGLGFFPSQVLASGSRVFFLGPKTGNATTSKVAIGYIDVPADPFAKSLTAKTALVSYNKPNANAISLQPRAVPDTVFLFDGTTPSIVAIEPPLTDATNLTTSPFTITVGDGLVAFSGPRAVTMNVNPANSVASFDLVSGLGTAAPKIEAAQPLAAVGPVNGPQTFSVSPEGALFWTIESITQPAANPPPTFVRAAKSYFLLGDTNTVTFDQASGVDIEPYPLVNPQGSVPIGPSVMLDAKTAMVTAATAQSFAQTSVQFVQKTPIGIVKNADSSPRRFVIPAAPGAVGLATSNGYGYVLTNDSATQMTVYIFDPACASQ